MLCMFSVHGIYLLSLLSKFSFFEFFMYTLSVCFFFYVLITVFIYCVIWMFYVSSVYFLCMFLEQSVYSLYILISVCSLCVFSVYSISCIFLCMFCMFFSLCVLYIYLQIQQSVGLDRQVRDAESFGLQNSTWVQYTLMLRLRGDHMALLGLVEPAYAL